MGWRRQTHEGVLKGVLKGVLLLSAAIGSAFEYRIVGFVDSSLFLQVRADTFVRSNASDRRAMQDRIELCVEPFPSIPENAGNASLLQPTPCPEEHADLLCS